MRGYAYIAAALAFSGSAFALICGGDKPLTQCCKSVAPWSSNSYDWGTLCGYTPANSNELVGERCVSISSGGTCPAGYISTCCAGHSSGPTGQCALGTNCAAAPQTLSASGPIPGSWAIVSDCAEDSGSRIITNYTVAILANNTPANCIAHCAAARLSIAGVEYGDECYCGTGFQPGTPQNIDGSQCSTACPGNGTLTCGGSWAIQLYRGPPPYPTGWSDAVTCAVDSATRVIANPAVNILHDNTPNRCMSFCQNAGYTLAGIENTDECYCGTEFLGGHPPASAPQSECDLPCAGDAALTCGGAWRMQTYSFSK